LLTECAMGRRRHPLRAYPEIKFQVKQADGTQEGGRSPEAAKAQEI
jgi:hypothetical protein